LVSANDVISLGSILVIIFSAAMVSLVLYSR